MMPYVHLDHSLAGCAAGDRLPLSEDDRHHLRTVLRLRPGADLEVSDGAGRSASAALEDDHVRLTGDVTIVAPPRPRLVVAQALPKARRFDEVVRQATELGVDAVVPVAAARSVTRLDDDRTHRAAGRWHAVALAAAEQSRRPHRPTIEPVVAPDGLVPLRDGAVLLVAVPGATPLPARLPACRAATEVTIAVGPEGGWTDDEVARLTRGGGEAVGLGPTVLRTEHAAAAALAVAAAALGRW